MYGLESVSTEESATRSPRLRLFLPWLVALLVIGGGAACGKTSAPQTPPIPTATPVATPSAAQAQQAVDRTLERLPRLQPLAFNERPQPAFISQEQLQVHLASQLDREKERRQISRDKDIYTMLGLVDDGVDLHRLYRDLLEEQVAGLYDYEEQRLYVVLRDEAFGMLEESTVVHELYHALQDQRFGLKSFFDDVEGDDDQSLARSAAVEGGAVYVELLYDQRYLDVSKLAALAEKQSTARLDAAPRAVREALLFPYTNGTRFVGTVQAGGGWESVDRLFREPPVSTEQVMHPLKYVQKEQPKPVALPNLLPALGPGWTERRTGVLGEFLAQQHLREFIDDRTADKAAAGWGGDRYASYQSNDGRRVFALLTTWDTADDAHEFYEAYQRLVPSRYPRIAALRRTATSRAWSGEGVSVTLSRQGANVLVVVAPDQQALGQVLGEFPGF